MVKVLTVTSHRLTFVLMYRALDNVPNADGWLTLLWPDAKTGPWLLRVRFASVKGRRECVGIELRSYRNADESALVPLPTEFDADGFTNPLPVLTTSTLRDVKIAEIAHDLRINEAAKATDRAELFSGPALSSLVPRHDILAAILRQTADEFTSAHADESELEKVAHVYRDAWARGDNPTAAVRDKFTISHSAAAKRVSRARAAGYLPKTSQGRGGLDATKKAK